MGGVKPFLCFCCCVVGVVWLSLIYCCCRVVVAVGLL